MKFVLRRGVLVCVFLLSASVQATLMQPFSVSELARSSDLIVEGVVVNKSCHRDTEGRIYTEVQLQVAEVWKGSVLTNTLTIVHGGGTIGNVRTEISDQVEYTVGEEVVAFLVVNPRREFVTLGLAQGKFHVWRDKQTGEKFAHNLFHGAPETTGHPEKTPAGAVAKQDSNCLRLSDLKQRAKEVLP